MLNTRNTSTQLTNELVILTIINLLVAELSYNSVRTVIHICMKQDQSYSDKSIISEKTIWFEFVKRTLL